jgi:hypothetical protein
MNQEQAFELVCEAYDAAEHAADEQYAVAMFCACANSLSREEKNKASAEAEAQFDCAMRAALKALNDARVLNI